MVRLLLELLFLYLFQSITRERFAIDIDEDVHCQDCKQQKVTLITKMVFNVITFQRLEITSVRTIFNKNSAFYKHLHFTNVNV